jgi:hypothetical protein
MNTLLFAILSLLSSTAAAPALQSAPIIQFQDVYGLREYLDYRRNQLVHCSGVNSPVKQKLMGKTVTAVFGPSALSMLGVGPDNVNDILIITEAGGGVNSYILPVIRDKCQLLPRSPMSSHHSSMIKNIKGDYLRNVYEHNFKGGDDMSKIFLTKGNTSRYVGNIELDKRILQNLYIPDRLGTTSAPAKSSMVTYKDIAGLHNYLDYRRNQVVYCARTDHFKRELGGKTVTAVFGPSAMAMLGIGAAHVNDILVQARNVAGYKRYIVPFTPGKCTLLPTTNGNQEKINIINKTTLKNVYSISFSTESDVDNGATFLEQGKSERYFGNIPLDTKFMNQGFVFSAEQFADMPMNFQEEMSRIGFTKPAQGSNPQVWGARWTAAN